MSAGVSAVRAEFDRLLARANAAVLDAATSGEAERTAALEAFRLAEEVPDLYL